MSFYKQIAPYYHHIFKINANQVGFIKFKTLKSDSKILDIGCGIGTLSFELANYYKNVLGIDMDAEMIRVASQKNGDVSKSIQFQQLSMLKLDTFIDKNSVDSIICFGNTLVHLNSLDEIANFLKQSKAVLKSNGKLLLQIVNYNRIIEKNIKQLPLIENDEIIFERNYCYRKPENKIDFNTRLIVKSTQQIIENSIELLPLLKEELALLLNKAGFNNCNYYGNFNMETYAIDSPALIIEAW
ncbi:class I SAM-dependent methyltransferase [Lutibacter flavus]|uniref:Methyltransferase domain-containing protein n=1 Tax=Lutibacter flavus TaxID=691689 RepID=A0A238VMR0_9FLAO|nr:class I SAM-dependent methyltransferase [Lutibacter flavus]SNR35454.1 Methyltransferase domain-containing protein [Lutibacter flavus]